MSNRTVEDANAWLTGRSCLLSLCTPKVRQRKINAITEIAVFIEGEKEMIELDHFVSTNA